MVSEIVPTAINQNTVNIVFLRDKFGNQIYPASQHFNTVFSVMFGRKN